MKKPHHRFAVVTADPEFHAVFKQAVSDSEKSTAIVLNRTDPTTFLEADLSEQLRRAEANVLVLDVGEASKESVTTTLATLAEIDDLRIILVGDPASAEYLLELLRAGVSDYLPKPIERSALDAALERVARGLVVSGLPGAKVGRVIGFVGPKGGTGVTTTVTNLAIKMQSLTRHSVLLADLNAELGTAAILLGVRPRYNFVELVKNLHRMDEDLIRSYVTEHESGVSLLTSPLTARDLEGVTKQRIDSTIGMLRSQFEHVVLDLGNAMTPLAQAGLSVCDEVVVVVTPEVPALRNAKRLMPLISQSGRLGQDELRFVVNQYDSKTDISVGQIEETLGQSVSMTLPSVRREATHAANVGRPLVMEGTSSYVKAVVRLAEDLATPGSLSGVTRPGRAASLFNRLRPLKSGKAQKGVRAHMPDQPLVEANGTSDRTSAAATGEA